jgi:hypothetical protein
VTGAEADAGVLLLPPILNENPDDDAGIGAGVLGLEPKEKTGFVAGLVVVVVDDVDPNEKATGAAVFVTTGKSGLLSELLGGGEAFGFGVLVVVGDLFSLLVLLLLVVVRRKNVEIYFSQGNVHSVRLSADFEIKSLKPSIKALLFLLAVSDPTESDDEEYTGSLGIAKLGLLL